MQAVGIRELKDRLSEYLRKVQAGEVVLVTDRGRVVAEIREPSAAPLTRPVPSGLQRLALEGRIRLGTIPNSPELYPRMTRVAPDGTADRLIDEDRDERS
jgi:antitoxin (DNA-binding transcriptional repressor) of toxin-antitoxin stability system